MQEKIMREILDEAKLSSAREVDLRKALADIEGAMAGAKITEDRWLAIGHHMAEAIKRAANEEQLEDIYDDTAEQIEQQYLNQSKAILAKLSNLGKTICSKPEVILLAIHLQCASSGF